MTLQDLIRSQGGLTKFAKNLRLTPHGVRRWLRHEGFPRATRIQKMVKMSKGKLTSDQILREISK